MRCPKCKTTEHTKIQKGRCPSCGTPVKLYKGRWYLTSQGNPSHTVLSHFERLVSQRLSAGRNIPVNFFVPQKSTRYVLEVKAADRMLDLADGDVSLVLEAIDLLFSDTRFSWKNRTSLMYLADDFLVTLALANANREERKVKETKEQKIIASLAARENIFGGALNE